MSFAITFTPDVYSPRRFAPRAAKFEAWVVDKEAANSRREYITETLCV